MVGCQQELSIGFKGRGRGDEEEEVGELRTKSCEERGGAPPRRRSRLCPRPTFFLLSFQVSER